MDTQNTNQEHSLSELDRYIEQTKRVRELSSPQASDLADEDDYRKCLLDNFTGIRSYYAENNRILRQHCIPHILSDKRLDDDAVELMSVFSRNLHDGRDITYTDAVLLYRQAKRLLREAEETDDNVLRMRALSFIIASTYHLSYMRFSSASAIRYREEGWSAVETMLGFFEKDRFVKLHAPAKYHLMENAAYYLRLFHGVIFDDNTEDPGRKSFVLNALIGMLQRMEDPFYLEQIPKTYQLAVERLACLEYIASLTDDNNAAGFDREELELIHAYTGELEQVWHAGGYDMSRVYTESLDAELPLYRCRNAYLAGKTDESTYKQAMREILAAYEDFDFSKNVPTVIMNTVREYLLLLAGKPVDAGDAAFLARVYSRFTDYMHRASKDNLFGYVIADASTILALFIEVPGGIGFEDLCLNTLAAIHPPTFIHTLSVASFSRCLTRALIEKEPSLFLGLLGCGEEAEVRERAAKIEDFVYHAALCHDFGKLMVAETIMNYGRDLMDEEMEMICFHPVAGARLLEKQAATAAYADVALGHHKWYDNSGGYPDTFDINASPLKNVISIVTCADCMDAATDEVGRSYKDGKSLDHFLEELREGSGKRYAPWLYPLFEDPAFRSQIENLLTEGRDENYRKTYRILRSHRTEA
ncbi:MAG: hypothetical protein IK016_05455 [Lachnospiraceae bacterium]|nr:hypothetical protein [Lachnospiraceae bacterium]